MKRTVSPTSPGGADIDVAVGDAEMDIAKVMYVCGMDPVDMDEVTIDEIVEKIKKTFSGKLDSEKPFASSMFMARQRWTLLISLRWNWFSRSALLAVKRNEQ